MATKSLPRFEPVIGFRELLRVLRPDGARRVEQMQNKCRYPGMAKLADAGDPRLVLAFQAVPKMFSSSVGSSSMEEARGSSLDFHFDDGAETAEVRRTS